MLFYYYRKNPAHFKEYSHPSKDDDDEEDESDEEDEITTSLTAKKQVGFEEVLELIFEVYLILDIIKWMHLQIYCTCTYCYVFKICFQYM